MPSHEEDVPRLAEIARTLSDFRSEFRNAMSEVVRKDVYGAHMASVQMQIDNLARENKQLAEGMERERTDKISDRRQTRNALVTASLSVVVAIIVLIMEVVIK